MSPSPRSQSELPTFRYHPEPVATGSVKANPAVPEAGDLTAYLFLCLHCGTHLAYTDAG